MKKINIDKLKRKLFKLLCYREDAIQVEHLNKDNFMWLVYEMQRRDYYIEIRAFPFLHDIEYLVTVSKYGGKSIYHYLHIDIITALVKSCVKALEGEKKMNFNEAINAALTDSNIVGAFLKNSRAVIAPIPEVNNKIVVIVSNLSDDDYKSDKWYLRYIEEPGKSSES